MIITLSVPGFESQTVTLLPIGGKGSAAPDNVPVQVVGTLDKNGAPFHSGDYAAGSGFALEFDVADDEIGAKTLTFGQSGTLGNATKTVTLEKDGVVIPVGPPLSRSASIVVNMGNPTAPNNLSPGRWTVKVLFSDPGAAVVVLG